MQFPGKWIRDPQSGSRVSNLVEADTTTINLPVNLSYEFTSAYRFLVRVINRDTLQTADIRLRVFVDGREVYNQAALMRHASLEYTHYYR